MAATITHLRPDTGRRTVPAGRLAELTADHDVAALAAEMPDVAHEMRRHATRTAVHLGLDPQDPRVIARLLDLARGSYCHGHMDASTDQRADTAGAALATVLHLRGGA
jgi:hypothetical protein